MYLLPCLFICSVIHLYQDGLMDIYLILWGTTHFFLVSRLVTQIAPPLAIKSSFRWLLHPLTSIQKISFLGLILLSHMNQSQEQVPASV